jgi:hypothetical protein
MKNTRKFLRSKRYLARLNDIRYQPFYTYTTEMSFEEAHRRFPMSDRLWSDGRKMAIEVYLPLEVEVTL